MPTPFAETSVGELEGFATQRNGQHPQIGGPLSVFLGIQQESAIGRPIVGQLINIVFQQWFRLARAVRRFTVKVVVALYDGSINNGLSVGTPDPKMISRA